MQVSHIGSFFSFGGYFSVDDYLLFIDPENKDEAAKIIEQNNKEYYDG